MIEDRMSTVSFTGHRTYDGSAAARLRTVVAELYQRGYRQFLSGMAVGFDLAAAEAVLALRETCPGLRLVAVVPFEGQESRFSAADRERYARVLAVADKRIVVCRCYRRDCYARRNDFLIDHASVVVAWYDGSAGGTRYTVLRARRCGLEVENLCNSAADVRACEPVLF